MLTSEGKSPSDMGPVLTANTIALGSDLQRLLEQSFRTQFTFFDGNTGEVLEKASELPGCDWSTRGEMCRIVSLRCKPEYIEENDPLVALALPISDSKGNCLVAVGVFLTRKLKPGESLERQANTFGMKPDELTQWADRQTPWTSDSLQTVCELVLDQVESHQRIKDLQEETSKMSVHIAGTYEEISLLYRLTHNLKISKSDEELGRITLKWLEEVLPAKGLALQLTPMSGADHSVTHNARDTTILISHGECPVDNRQFSALVTHLDVGKNYRPMVVNRLITSREDWPFPSVRQVVIVPMAEGTNLFGWLAAFNHLTDAEFGRVEATLLNTVAAVLGIKTGNG